MNEKPLTTFVYWTLLRPEWYVDSFHRRKWGKTQFQQKPNSNQTQQFLPRQQNVIFTVLIYISINLNAIELLITFDEWPMLLLFDGYKPMFHSSAYYSLITAPLSYTAITVQKYSTALHTVKGNTAAILNKFMWWLQKKSLNSSVQYMSNDHHCDHLLLMTTVCDI